MSTGNQPSKTALDGLKRVASVRDVAAVPPPMRAHPRRASVEDAVRDGWTRGAYVACQCGQTVELEVRRELDGPVVAVAEVSRSRIAFRPQPTGGEMTKRTVLSVLLSAFACFGLAAVEPLTPQTAQIAINMGQAVKKTSDLCWSDDVTLEKFASSRAFFVSIGTPFCDLAVRAFEAKRKYEPAPTADSIPAPEDQVVTVSVSPEGSYSAIGIVKHATRISSVEKVVLKRGVEIVQPVRSTFHDVTFSNAYGKTEVYRAGDFSFPLSAFEPSGTTVIVIIYEGGAAGDEAMQVLSQRDLKKLR